MFKFALANIAFQSRFRNRQARLWVITVIASLVVLPYSAAHPAGTTKIKRTETDTLQDNVLLTVLLIISTVLAIAPYFVEFSVAYKSRKSTASPAIYFTARTWILHTTTTIWAVLLITATYKASSFLHLSDSGDAASCTLSPINADIAGVGVRGSIWLSGTMVIAMALLGHLHAEVTGVKEISPAVLLAQVYYTVNILIGYKTGLAAADLLVAAMILDSLTSIFSITFSMKECLASRLLISLGLGFQLFALFVLAFVIAKLPTVGAEEGAVDASCRCFRAYWWGPVDTCTGVSWSFWLYYGLRFTTWAHDAWLCLWHMHRFDAAEKAARDENNTDIHLESSVYDSIRATTFTKYMEWIPIFMGSAINLELTLQRYRLQGFEEIAGWGQTTPLIVALAAFFRWCYVLYAMFQEKSARRRTETLEKSGINPFFPSLYRSAKGRSFWARTLNLLDRACPNHPFGMLPLRPVNHPRIAYVDLAWKKEFKLSSLRWPYKTPQELGLMLVEAAGFGDMVMVTDLLAEKAGINETTEKGETALINAATNGHIRIVELLLRAGANVNMLALHDKSALHCAAGQGHKETVKLLLENGADFNNVDENENSPLHHAAGGGHEPVVRILLDKGAMVNAKNRFLESALHLAASNGHASVAELLLEKGAGVDILAKVGQPPLHQAAEKGHEAVVKVLVDRGADLNILDGSGDSALHIAAGEGHAGVVELLLDRGMEANVLGRWSKQTPLHAAAFKGREVVVKQLLAKGAEVSLDRYKQSALHLATQNDHEAVVKLLLDKIVDPNLPEVKGTEALHSAAHRGYDGIVKLLLDKGVDPRVLAKGKSVLLSAAGEGHEAVVELLLDHGLDINLLDQQNFSAILHAAYGGHEAVVKLLLDRGAEVNLRDNYQSSALHRASNRGHSTVVKLLLDNGADVNGQDQDGLTALHSATYQGHLAIVELLLERGADINALTMDNWSPLHHPVGLGYEEVVKLLLDKGADVDVLAERAGSALHHAVSKGNERIVKMLLGTRANANLLDQKGETALHCAATRGSEPLVRLLLKAGADIYILNANGQSAQDFASINGHRGVEKILTQAARTKNAQLSSR